MAKDRTEWPAELKHAENCNWRFGMHAECNCGVEEEKACRRKISNVFAHVADGVRKALEPSGFHVHVRTNARQVVVTDVLHPENKEVFVINVDRKAS